MFKRYIVKDKKIEETTDDDSSIIVVVSPDDSEKELIRERYSIDEHTLNSAFDPEEPGRLEIEDNYLSIIFKRPKQRSPKDEFHFYVTSIGLFLFRDRLIVAIPEDVNLFIGKYFRQCNDIKDVFLKLLYSSISHFMELLSVINNIANELETEINHSMGNKNLLNMFSLEKSLIYFVSAIMGNTMVLERLRKGAEKFRFTEDEIDYIDDIRIENQQCYRQASIYSDVFASLTGARASIVSNNLNMLMKNLNAVVIAVAIPSFFAGVGGMSEISVITGITDPRKSYSLFLLLMAVVACVTYFIIQRMDRD